MSLLASHGRAMASVSADAARARRTPTMETAISLARTTWLSVRADEERRGGRVVAELASHDQDAQHEDHEGPGRRSRDDAAKAFARRECRSRPGVPGGQDADGHADGHEGQRSDGVEVEHAGGAELEQLGSDQVVHRTAPSGLVSARKYCSRSKC